MPYTRKAPRILKRHLVTLAGLERVNQQVAREMESLGLWSPGHADVEVWLVPVSLNCYGWHSGSPGSISIPAVSFAHLGDYLYGYHTRLSDIMRHERAHALAEIHPAFFDCPAFVRCFGGEYGSTRPAVDFHRDRHLTPYAATSPCENFAETFHFYLRHKGRLPVRLQDRLAIVRKWRFIQLMARRISRSTPTTLTQP